ncbi:MAG TPA: LysM peptidoglycan-binding domain-containing protein [Verrucomicrobiae bacterium]|nr:LysM peptidoglycan-binding domain-containing protein [Verrucomicrobiae bacterium]
MRWRRLGILSLGINLLLAAGLWAALHQIGVRANSGAPKDLAPTNSQNPKVIVRRQFFSWSEVESSDYPTYIANLRDIGCPEQTIRDIIIADVNSLFAKRRATELVTSEQQWWRSDPDTNVLAVAAEKSRALEDERRALLTRLLGTNWEAGDIVSLPRPTRPGVLLDGPVLGQLSVDTKEAVQEVSLRSEDKLQAYIDSQRAQGKDPDPVEIAKLRAETRQELSKVLTAPELEEFLLRYSQNANDLRTDFGQLQYFNPSAEEFRAVFRATDQIDQQLALLADATDANSVAQKKNLLAERENAIKIALGPDRYQDYHLLQDPAYRDAVAAADAAGTPDAAQTIYQINLATLAEQDRIRGDTNLTDAQRLIELKRVELDQLQATTAASGQEVPPEPVPTPTPPPPKTHLIRPGDTAAVVALMYGLPVSALQAANPNVDFSRLKAGDSLVIPPTHLPGFGP